METRNLAHDVGDSDDEDGANDVVAVAADGAGGERADGACGDEDDVGGSAMVDQTSLGSANRENRIVAAVAVDIVGAVDTES